jgi:hypothetical protein
MVVTCEMRYFEFEELTFGSGSHDSDILTSKVFGDIQGTVSWLRTLYIRVVSSL